MLEIIIPGCLIALWFVVQSKVTKFNVHMKDDFGLDIPNDFIVQFKRKKSGKRICPDDFASFIDAVRGRQFPLSLQMAGHQITVVIDFCVNGVPSHIRPVCGMEGRNRNSAIDFGSGPLGVQRVSLSHKSNLNPADAMSDISSKKSGGDT